MLPGFVQRHWGRIVLVLVLALVAGVRMRLLDLPLERDEGEYAYAGQLILQGVPPYKLAYNMKFPGTYFAYALIMLVFGQTPAGIHLGLTCVTTLTGLMLYWLGRRVLDETAGVVAATTHAVLAASPALLGLAAHATHFAALFATAGLCIVWPARQHPGWVRVAAGGFMFGLATLMKQHAAIFLLWGVAFIGLKVWQRQVTLGWGIRLLVAFCLGAAAPISVCCLALWCAGVWQHFVFWTIIYASEYARVLPLSEVPGVLLGALTGVTERDPALWAVVILGVGFVLGDAQLAKCRGPLLSFLVAAVLSTVPGFYFRRHYFILPLPAFALAAGCGVSAARTFLAGTRWKWGGRVPALVYMCALALSFYQNSDIWFKATPRQAVTKIYLGNPFAESEVIAAYIRTNTAPDAKIAILGSEPQIFFLARRRSATGYIYTYPLMEPHRYAASMHEQMIQEIESAKPEFVLAVKVPLSWLGRPESDTRILEWWAGSYRTNYVLVGVAVMKPPAETEYYWDQAAIEFGERLKWGVLVYRRTAP